MAWNSLTANVVTPTAYYGLFQTSDRLMRVTYYKTGLVFDGHSLPWLLGWIVITGVVTAITAPAQASIMLPEAPAFTLDEDINQNALSSGAGGNSSVPSEEPAKTSEHHLPELLIPQHASNTGGMTGGTSSSTSGSTGGWSVSALSAVDTILLIDPAVAGWISGESRFALPLPPGNDLLRPPQEV